MNADSVIGLLHPGEMGAALGAVLRTEGHSVLWASAGRSPDTVQRAASAGLEDAGSVAQLARRSNVVLSVCPPHAALDVVETLPAFGGIYVDANAISPETARTIERRVSARGARFVDAGIVGPPPPTSGRTRLYLAGSEAAEVAALFARAQLETVILAGPAGAASALKMTYAAWTKGTAALLLAIRAVARAEGVEDALLAEWSTSQPELDARLRAAARSAATKGWRWSGEMEQIAATFEGAGLPEGFHHAAADVYRRSPRLGVAAASAEDLVELLTQALLEHPG